MENPKTVVDAILNEGKTNETASGVKVYQMTIRRYAFLEKLDSPFLNPDVKFSVSTVIPSLYVATSDNDTLKRYSAYGTGDIERICQDAYDWADGISLDAIPDIINAVTNQLLEMNKVSPTQSEGSNSKKN